MDVTTDLRPGRRVDFEQLHDVWVAWVRLPDLGPLSDGDVRSAHRHALHEAFLAEGTERAAIVKRAVGPLAAELRRRGLDVFEVADEVPSYSRPGEGSGEDEEAPDVPMISPRESALRSLDERELRERHVRVMRAVFAASGPHRMGLGVGVLKPIEAEMRRRGLKADYWSAEHQRRSNAAFRAGSN